MQYYMLQGNYCALLFRIINRMLRVIERFERTFIGTMESKPTSSITNENPYKLW